MAIQIKTLEQLKLMRSAGKIVWQTLIEIKKTAAVGVTTEELDQLAREILSSNGATSSLLGYRDWETDRKSTRLNSSHRL